MATGQVVKYGAIGGLFLLVLVVVIWQKGELRGELTSHSDSTRISELSGDSPRADDQEEVGEVLMLLREELGQLRGEMHAQQNSLHAVRQQLADVREGWDAANDRVVGQTSDSEDGLQNEQLFQYPFCDVDMEQQRRAEQERAAKIVDTLNNQLASEPYDGAWAPQMQESITATLQQDLFANSQLVELACQASLCRIDVEHNDAEAEMGFLREFVAQAGFTDTQAYYSRQQLAEDAVQMTYFVSRDGQGLPLQSLDSE